MKVSVAGSVAWSPSAVLSFVIGNLRGTLGPLVPRGPNETASSEETGGGRTPRPDRPNALLGRPFSGCRRLAALGLQQLLALVILDPLVARTGLARLFRQLLHSDLANVLLELRAWSAAEVGPSRSVVAVGYLEDAGATPQADALTQEPHIDRRGLLTGDPTEHCFGGLRA